MEALGFQFKKSSEERTIRMICSQFEIIHLDHNIIEKVIAIKQKKKIKLPDAIIAATAIHLKLDLITANTDDFKNIDVSLCIINPLT